MARAGECPSCKHRFDHLERVPLVSVVCGHSLCAACVHPPPSEPAEDDDDDAASISTSSSDPDDESPGLSVCPVCSATLGGFVKNFDALSALEAAARMRPSAIPAPDLSSVVHEDLVIDRAAIKFARNPVNELGAGSSAIVYRGVHNELPVAIKCIRTMSDSWATEDRLRRELRNASRLKNAHIVEFRGAAWDHEAGPHSPRNVLLVTELMAGGNLRESLNYLPPDTGLALESFVQIGLQITRGIEYLHAEGLAHRDVKSANILLTERLKKGVARFSPDVRAKIADFGLSKYIDKATGGGTVMQSIMEPGRLEATYAYLAPEAFGGDKSNAMQRNEESDDDDGRYDEMAKKRDIYALGVLFWEMLTGQIPWSGVSLPDVYVRVCVRSDRPGPALDDTKVSKSVRRLVERCWAQSPTRRPSAKSIAAKLEKIAVKIGVTNPTGTSTAGSAKAKSAAAAAMESVSVVSGNTPSGVNLDGPSTKNVPDLHSEPLREIPENGRDQHQQIHIGGDSPMLYQKMPSASTVYTAHNECSKTHSTLGPETNDARDLDRVVEDIPGQFDDSVWVDDGESNAQSMTKNAPTSGKTGVSATSSRNGASSAPNLGQAATSASGGTSQGMIHVKSHGSKGTQGCSNAAADAGDNGPSSLNRRQHRARHPAADEIPERGRTPTTPATPTGPCVQSSANIHGKSTATAVAATAAAIAAAKDRERKRDDVRGTRGPTSRVARAVNTTAGMVGNTVGDASFQSLPSAGEGWQRSAAKDQRVMFFDNSDEEAQDFDPERAAAEEAIAESNNNAVNQPVASRSQTNAAPRAPPQQAQRSSSMNRVVNRPKSPTVKRPMSPTASRHAPVVTATTATVAGTATAVTMSYSRPVPDDEPPVKAAPSSAPRASEAAPPKRGSRSTRGRLSRTMSASAPSNSATGRTTPIITSSSTKLASSGAVSESTGKRAFIRRMRSNESPRRIARSSSSTGAENKRPPPPLVNKNHSHVTDIPGSDDEDAEYTVMQIGSGPKEDFRATVEEVDKSGLIRLLSQRMTPVRLAALAHAALINPKHRGEEELIRNSCAILHRLTVPGNSSQSRNNVQEVSPKEQLSVRKYLKCNRGVEALLQAMHPPRSRHPTTLSYALLALGNLTAWDLEAHKQFRTSHGVLQITNVMRAHVQNAGVQEKGCYALACVGAAYPAKAKGVFEDAGALDVVIEALSDVQREEPNDAVTKQACAALGAMCSSSPPNALYSGRKEALTYLVTAFERFRRYSRVDGGKRSEMRLVCKAFIDLLCHGENRKMAGAKGGSTMIMRAMRIFRLDADFMEKGLATLSEFCTYRSNGMQIVQASGVDDIVAAMVRFPVIVNMQKEGSRILTLLMKATGDQARRRLVHAGGGEAIVLALDRFGGDSESNVPVVIETCRCLHTLFQMENPGEGEILGRRMKKVKCDKAIKNALTAHRANQTVQEKGREALKQLGTLKGGSGLWGRMRSGPKKR